MTLSVIRTVDGSRQRIEGKADFKNPASLARCNWLIETRHASPSEVQTYPSHAAGCLEFKLKLARCSCSPRRNIETYGARYSTFHDTVLSRLACPAPSPGIIGLAPQACAVLRRLGTLSGSCAGIGTSYSAIFRRSRMGTSRTGLQSIHRSTGGLR